MTVPTASAHDAAALWAARLEGSDLSATDRQDLQHWLEADPAHRDSLSGYCQFSADLEEPLAAFAAAGRIVPAVAPAPARRRPWQFGLALAGLAAAAIVTVVWIVSPTTQFANVATPVGQRQSLALADGSQVELDARTSLRIELDQTVRRIRLAKARRSSPSPRTPTARSWWRLPPAPCAYAAPGLMCAILTTTNWS